MCVRPLTRSPLAATPFPCPANFTNLGNDVLESRQGLVYMRRTDTEHYIEHVMAHTRPNPGKPLHGVFKVKDQDELLAMIDDAWARGGTRVPTNGSNRVTRVDYDEAIGENGEKYLCIVTSPPKKGRHKIRTVFPASDPSCPRR